MKCDLGGFLNVKLFAIWMVCVVVEYGGGIHFMWGWSTGDIDLFLFFHLINYKYVTFL